MAHNLYTRPTEDQELNNLDVVEDYISYSMYNVWIPARSFMEGATFNGGSEFVVAPLAETTPTLEYPNATDSLFRFGMRKPLMWKSGFVNMTLYWVSESNQPGNILIQFGIDIYRLGDLLNANSPSSNTATNAAIAMPGTAWKLSQTLLPEILAPCDQSHAFLDLYIYRLGSHASDTYPDKWYLLGVELEYKENKRELGDKPRELKR